MTLYLPPLIDDDPTFFPPIETALTQPDGLLAIGGDLSERRLICAYEQGIFPWFSLHDPYLWWSPSTRAILLPHAFKPSKSLQKTVRKQKYTVSINHCFNEVITRCALIRGEKDVWVTQEMREAYSRLHLSGKAHSVEVWEENQLIGGLYGVCLGGVFCGESMFSIKTDASKTALWFFCAHFTKHGGRLIDCQMMTPHLSRMGASALTRDDFIFKLKSCQKIILEGSVFHQQWLRHPHE